ncbi:hypothetical protein QWZ13_03315 [Reinekea marina]|nr:hypothetical protein [Reinekea marina]MDN3647941.1 hypothetical protein [Reinekea marina]
MCGCLKQVRLFCADFQFKPFDLSLFFNILVRLIWLKGRYLHSQFHMQ